MKAENKKENLERIKKRNSIFNIKEFKNNELILKSYPRKVFVELTRNCNNFCVMCTYRTLTLKTIKYNPKFDMPFSLFKKVADTLFPYAEYADLRGWGESTILKNFMDYVDYALKFNCTFGLNTNLTIQNDEMWEKLVKNNFIFDISFDGATKTTFEFIRRGAVFGDVMNNVKKLIDFANEYNKSTSNFSFLVTVQRYNIKEIPKIVELANKLGIKKIRLSPVSLDDKDPNNLLNCPKEIKKFIPIAIRLAKEKNIEIKLIGSFGLDRIENNNGFKVQKRCETPWSSIYINYRGFVGPCDCLMPLVFEKFDLKNKDFREVWNSPSFTLFRSMVNTKYRKHLNKLCEWCFENRFVHQHLSDGIENSS